MSDDRAEFPGGAVDVSGGSDSATYSGNDTIVSLYVGGTGDVKVDTISGDAVTFSSVPAGTFIKAEITKVYSTGTTATLMVGLQRK